MKRKSKHSKQPSNQRFYNSDAQRFLELTRFRKLQAQELREMEDSFFIEKDSLEAEYELALFYDKSVG